MKLRLTRKNCVNKRKCTKKNCTKKNRVTRKHGGFLFFDKGKSKTLDKYIMTNKLKEEAKKNTKNDLVLMTYDAMMHLSVEKMRKNPKKYCDKIVYRILYPKLKNDDYVLYTLLNDIIRNNKLIKKNSSTKNIFELIEESKLKTSKHHKLYERYQKGPKYESLRNVSKNVYY